MDKRRSDYLHSKQDVFAEPAADANRLDFNDIPFVVPANDNLGTKDRLSAPLRKPASSTNRNARLPLIRTKPVSNVVRSSLRPASRQLIARLIKAGYLPPALRHDADAVTAAIARLKQDLRSGGGDDHRGWRRADL
jgi:hypothetical protein